MWERIPMAGDATGSQGEGTRMLTEYEARIITRCRINDGNPQYRPRWVMGPPVAIGLILIATFAFSAHERPPPSRGGRLGP